MGKMDNGLIIAGVGVVLIAVGLVFGYLSGIHIEHTVTALNFLSSVVDYLESIVISGVLMAAGVLMVIFGLKKS
jgi:cell division protein FtsX